MADENPDEIGSRTAKGGFNNEHEVVQKFNSWPRDHHSQDWVISFGCQPQSISQVRAHKVAGSFKADICVSIDSVGIQSSRQFMVQAKLVSSTVGFNQIDKRWVDSYAEMWNLSSQIVTSLKRFTGEIVPQNGESKDPRRIKLSEMQPQESRQIITFFEDNKKQVVSDLLRGRGKNAADWILVTHKTQEEISYKIMPIETAIEIACEGEVQISKRGSLEIGQVLMQRKGGDAGRPTAKMLQFKLNPMIFMNQTTDRT